MCIRDRAIAWHLKEALGADKFNYSRVRFNQITKDAILESFEDPKDIDSSLVEAQQARRFLDRVVGFELSPLLWAKIARNLSAGRVQSVALRLLVEREHSIQKFKPEEFWEISFKVNGNLCISSDPFFIEKSTKQPVEKIDNCKVTSYTLPHHTKCTEKEYNDHSGDEGYLENQGFYLYRRGRLICKSTWFNLGKKLEMRKLCRVSIDIENNTDADWQLDVKKSRATPPPRIKSRLRKLIDTFSRPSAIKYTSRVINKKLQGITNLTAIFTSNIVRFSKTCFIRIHK